MTKRAKPKNKISSQKWKKYKIEGDKLIKGKMCPKCNVFLGEHKSRSVCGKCGYTEFKK